MTSQPNPQLPRTRTRNGKLTKGEKRTLAIIAVILPLLFLLPLLATSIAIPFLLIASSGLITGAMAHRKGYSFESWWFALGLFGLLFVAFLPVVENSGTPQQAARQKHKGDQLGHNLSTLTLVLILLFLTVFGATALTLLINATKGW